MRSGLKSSGSNESAGHRKRTSNRPDRIPRSEAAADRSIWAVAHVEREAYEARSRVDHIAASVTRKAGSGTVIVLHLIWFSAWVTASIHLFGMKAFDPFPFSLLT